MKKNKAKLNPLLDYRCQYQKDTIKGSKCTKDPNHHHHYCFVDSKNFRQTSCYKCYRLDAMRIWDD